MCLGGREKRRDGGHRDLPRALTFLFLVAIVALGLLGAVPLPLLAQEGEWRSFGPLRVAEHNPLLRLVHVPRAETAELLDPGSLKFDLFTDYSNIFEQSQSTFHFQRFDMERMTNDLSVRYGFGENWEVGGRIGIHTSWGGFLDSFVDSFHDFFGLPNGNRDAFPEDEVEFSFVDSRRQMNVDRKPETSAVEDVRLFAKRRLWGSADEASTTSARASLRFASGEFAGDTGRPDLALTLLHRRSWGRWHLHLEAGGTTLNAPDEFDPLFNDVAAFFSTALEVNIVSSVSFIGQFVGGSPYTGGVGVSELDRPPVNLVFGFAGQVAEEWGWQFAFGEDVPANSPSVDFTVTVGVSRTLR